MVWGKPEFNFFPTQSFILAFVSPWYEHFKRQQFLRFWSLQKQVGATASIHSTALQGFVQRAGIHPSTSNPWSRLKKKKSENIKDEPLFFMQKQQRPFLVRKETFLALALRTEMYCSFENLNSMHYFPQELINKYFSCIIVL